MIVLSTLGSAAIDVNGHRITPTAERTFAGALYLAVERGREVPRAVLQELLFPEATISNGAHSLRQLLYKFRKWGLDLGTDPTTACIGADIVGDPVARIAGGQRVEAEQLRDIAGGYLPAYAPSVSESFAEWLDAHRSAATASLLRALSTQLAAAKEAHDWVRTDLLARACLGLDTLNEEATLVLAENLALTGAKSEAVGMLDRLMVDLGQGSTALKLPATVLRRRISERMPDSYGKQESPLVDRDAELRAIGGFLDAVGASSAVMLMLTGDPGIGKTRLMERTERMAGIAGVSTVRIAVHPHYVRRPLSLFSDAIPQLLRMPGALGCSPESLQYLRVLQEGSAEHLSPAAREPDAEAQFARVLRAIDDVLDAITSENRLLLIIEDAHDLDPLSARVLSTITAKRGSRRLLVAATLRPGSDAGETLRRNERSMVISLAPLSPEGSAELVKQLLVLHRVIADSELTEWWVSVAGGNPLFVTMLVVHHARTGARFAIPRTLNELLLKRLEGLGESTVLFFEACAVLGENATVAHIEYCTGLSVHELHAAMRELEGYGLIEVSGQLVQPVHRLLTDAALAGAPSTVRMLLHRRAAEVLDGSQTAPAARWSAAEHWASTGDDEREAASLQSCADQLLAIGRPSEACDLFEQAAGQCEGTSQATHLLLAAMHSAETAGRWGTVDDLIKRVRAATTVAAHDDETHAHYMLGLEASYTVGADFRNDVDGLITLSSDITQSPTVRLRSCKLLVTIADVLWSPELGHVAGLASQQASATSARDIECQITTAMVYQMAFGDIAEGARYAHELLAIAHAQEPCGRVANAIGNAALAMHLAGETSEALSVLSTYGRILRDRRLFASAYATTARLASVHFDLCNYAEGGRLQQSADHLAIEAVDRGFVSGFISNRIRMALYNNELAAALSLVEDLEANVPASRIGRHRWVGLAYRARINRLRGSADHDLVDMLLPAHFEGRRFLGHDDIAAEVFYGLSMTGRGEYARTLLEEYVGTHRRERIGPTLDLRNALDECGLDVQFYSESALGH